MLRHILHMTGIDGRSITHLTDQVTVLIDMGAYYGDTVLAIGAISTVVTFVSLVTFCNDSGIRSIHIPVAIVSNSDDRRMAIIAFYTLDTLSTIGAVRESKCRSRAIGIGNRISIYISICGRLLDADDGDALITFVAFIAFGIHTRIGITDPPMTIVSDIRSLSVDAIGDNEGRGRAIRIGDGIGIHIAIRGCLSYLGYSFPVISLISLCLDTGIDIIHIPVSVTADGDCWSMAIISILPVHNGKG